MMVVRSLVTCSVVLSLTFYLIQCKKRSDASAVLEDQAIADDSEDYELASEIVRFEFDDTTIAALSQLESNLPQIAQQLYPEDALRQKAFNLSSALNITIIRDSQRVPIGLNVNLPYTGSSEEEEALAAEIQNQPVTQQTASYAPGTRVCTRTLFTYTSTRGFSQSDLQWDCQNTARNSYGYPYAELCIYGGRYACCGEKPCSSSYNNTLRREGLRQAPSGGRVRLGVRLR